MASRIETYPDGRDLDVGTLRIKRPVYTDAGSHAKCNLFYARGAAADAAEEQPFMIRLRRMCCDSIATLADGTVERLVLREQQQQQQEQSGVLQKLLEICEKVSVKIGNRYPMLFCDKSAMYAWLSADGRALCVSMPRDARLRDCSGRRFVPWSSLQKDHAVDVILRVQNWWTSKSGYGVNLRVLHVLDADVDAAKEDMIDQASTNEVFLEAQLRALHDRYEALHHEHAQLKLEHAQQRALLEMLAAESAEDEDDVAH